MNEEEMTPTEIALAQRVTELEERIEDLFRATVCMLASHGGKFVFTDALFEDAAKWALNQERNFAQGVHILSLQPKRIPIQLFQAAKQLEDQIERGRAEESEEDNGDGPTEFPFA